MSFIVKALISKDCFVLLVFTFFAFLAHSCHASDYCGQPVPFDIANEGYEQNKGFAKDAFFDPGEKSKDQSTPTLSGNVVYIPPGATIPITLDRPIGSGFSKVGSIAYARMDSQMFGIPPGTIAELSVIMVEPSARFFGRPGRIQIASNRLIMPNGRSVWLRGLVVDRIGQSKLSGSTGGKRFAKSVSKVALGAGVGAASGLGIGAAADGRLGTATLVGAAIGAVIGGIWAAATKGQDVTLPQGMPVSLSVVEGAQAYF
ncbi:MAG: hypothetical protein SFU25_10280 [Candidatus Caenarcaniphilales bacterium]|nr:hypothetical protein [Candidatus Caenarcaniphilales bacterium]